MNTNRSAATIVIFGASGDLMQRKLGPALFRLFSTRRLPPQTRIVGFARSPWQDAEFQQHVRDGIRAFSTDFVESTWSAFASCLQYQQGDLEAASDYASLRARLDALDGGITDRLYYLAVAPRFFRDAITHIGAAQLASVASPHAGRRDIVIEKPFGHDRASALELNGCVHSVFDERQVYRIDHYLGKETAQNILYFRFANAIFDSLLNRQYVDNVQISVAEDVTVDHRGEYYDRAGVLRDMFQNHLLQLLTLIAMEPPTPYDATQLRNEKVKVLAATRPIVSADTVCAQYDGFCETRGVARSSRTPTYAAMRLFVDNWRWSGVPFYLRSGKALAGKSSEINIEFKRPAYQMFGTFQSPTPNVLSICVQPDEGVHLSFDAKVPDTHDVRAVDFAFHYKTSFPGIPVADAYDRLLDDAIRGDPSLFARSDEIDSAWRLIDPVIATWEAASGPPVARYVPGSWGPQEAAHLLARDGLRWRAGCGQHD